MNGLSKNLRTHILELTKDREIPITQEQYKAIKISQSMDKWNDPLMIHDPDTEKVLHDGLIKDILGFREIEKNDLGGANFVCDFANRHPIHVECKCSETYRKFPIDFRMKSFELFKKYPIQLTLSEKRSVLDSIPTY